MILRHLWKQRLKTLLFRTLNKGRAFMNDSLLEYAKNTVQRLKDNKLHIATAESCTGGMFSTYIAAIPGASAVFELGICSYSSRIKNKILSVKTATLEKFGAVSHEAAAQMAANVRILGDADLGISVTGVAGPDFSEGKKPGTVYIALANSRSVKVQKLDIESGSRFQIQHAAVRAMFELLDEYLEKM